MVNIRPRHSKATMATKKQWSTYNTSTYSPLAKQWTNTNTDMQLVHPQNWTRADQQVRRGSQADRFSDYQKYAYKASLKLQIEQI
jgi:hypothetical protein